MAKKILVSKHRGDGNPKVFTMLNGSLNQVGEDLPTSMEPDNSKSLGRNRVIEFEGELYCAQNYNIFKYSQESGTWGLERGGSGIANSENHLDVGLFVSMIGGEPYLYHIFAGSASASVISYNRKASKFSSNGEWSEGSNISASQTMWAGDQDTTLPGLLDCIQFNNIVYFLYAYDDVSFGADGFRAIYLFDMETNTAGAIALPAPYVTNGATCPPASFCVHNNRLFLMAYDGVDATTTRFDGISLLEIVGSTCIRKLTIPFNASSTNGTLWGEPAWEEGRHALFSDEDYMYMLWHRVDSTTNYGFHLHVFSAPEDSSSITGVDDVGNTVLPNSISQSGGQLPNIRARWCPYTQVDSSGNSEIFLMHTTFGLEGSIGTIFKFNGSGEGLTVAGVGGDASFSMPNNRTGGGQYEWSVYKQFDSHIENIRPSVVNGHMEIDFRITNGSGQDVSAMLLYDSKGEHINTFATISFTSQGSVVNSNTITGITADSGNLYTATWAAEADGLSSGDTFEIMPLIILA